MWDLPGPGLEPVSPALAGGFSTSAPPGEPSRAFLQSLASAQTCLPAPRSTLQGALAKITLQRLPVNLLLSCASQHQAARITYTSPNPFLWKKPFIPSTGDCSWPLYFASGKLKSDSFLGSVYVKVPRKGVKYLTK